MSVYSYEARNQYKKNKKAVVGQNKTTFIYFILTGVILSIFLLVIKMQNSAGKDIVVKVETVNFIMLSYFIVLAVIKKHIYKLFDKCNSVALMYLFVTPPIVCSMLTGAVFISPEKEAFVFFLFITIFPLFIMDKPLRMVAYITGMSIVFIILVYIKKEESVRIYDIDHTVEFYIGTLVVNMMILRLRFNNMQHLMDAESRSEMDPGTELKNRAGFMSDKTFYDGKNIFVGVMGIDDFNLFNDLYGYEISELVMKGFADKIRHEFFEDRIYRMSMDTILVVDDFTNLKESLDKINRIKKEMKNLKINQQYFHPTFSIGYVYGDNSDKKISKMYRIADTYFVRSRNIGKNRVLGGEFDARDYTKSDGITRRDVNAGVDSLTGLLDMGTFIRNSEYVLNNVVDWNRKVDILYLNIVNLKVYNERNGFTAGDELLKYVADQLKMHFQGINMARFSDDHFVMLCFDDEVERGLKYIIENVAEYTQISTVVLKVGVYTMEGNESIDKACDNAKIACKSIKNNKNESIRYYDKRLDDKNKMVKYVLSNFDKALAEGWIRVFYQPVIARETGKICGAESLSRWIDPVKGIISPADYIPILEDNRLIRKYDLYVIEEALREFEKRKDTFGFPISVNLSRYDFYENDIVERITEMADKYGISHDRVHIEITESAITDNEEFLKGQVDLFHKNGFEVWMDDFGSGYSSLNVLQDFDFDLIKLDMRFMKNFEVGNKNSIIVKQVIEMAKALNIHTLTEGVETEEQKNFLNEVGCERIQGYYYSKPDTLDNLKHKVSEGSLPEIESW